MKIKRFMQSMLESLLLPLMTIICFKKIRECRERSKKVLFVANNELMFQHVKQVWSTYYRKDDYEIHLCSTDTIVIRFSKYQTLRRMKELAKSKGMQFWPDYMAGKIEWDLLITAEPDVPVELCKASNKAILIQHALLGIKIVDGWLYPYHPQRCFINDRCKFDAIFETNRYASDKVIKEDARYSNVIKLVGHLAADELMALNKKRDQIREDSGYTKDDYVVLIQSTFRESLIEDLGFELLEQCRKISQDYGWKFIISLHPNHWRGDHSVKQPWGKVALGFESDRIQIRQPDEYANLSLVACDIVVTDHTSLCYNYALLGKPALFYLPPHGNQVMEILGELVACCATIQKSGELYEKLQEAERVFNKQGVEKLLADMLPYLGKASERNDEILDEILKKH